MRLDCNARCPSQSKSVTNGTTFKEQNIVRRSANYKPTIWHSEFLQSLGSKYAVNLQAHAQHTHSHIYIHTLTYKYIYVLYDVGCGLIRTSPTHIFSNVFHIFF